MRSRPTSRFGILVLLSVLRARPTDAARASTSHKATFQLFDSHEVQLDASRHAEEFFTFVTRPDINAPRWNVQVFDEDNLSPGYWFTAPYSNVRQVRHDGPWNGPTIYDSRGELVWSGAPLLGGFSSFDFRVSNVRGESMLSLINSNLNETRVMIFDESYQVYKTIGMGRIEGEEHQPTINMHEFLTVDHGNTALYMTNEPKRVNRSLSEAVGFHGECYVQVDSIREVDTWTWEVMNEWSPEGHIGLDESYVTQMAPEERCTSERAWGYLHLNSIDIFPNGDYLVSGRRTDAIYRISRATGAVVWRLGGRKSDFHQSFSFSGQHAAKVYESNDTHTTITFLDNAIGPGVRKSTNDISRGLVVQLDTSAMTARIVTEFTHPVGAYTSSRGNMQTLPNGNAWLSWVDSSLQSEHGPDGSLLMEANLKANLASYRAFKYPWIGRPSAPPDVHAKLIDTNGRWYTIVHMSWNGATEVHEWKVYDTNAAGDISSVIRQVPKQGFETSAFIEGRNHHVFVEAVDRDGNLLGKSAVFTSILPRKYNTRTPLMVGIFAGLLIGLLIWSVWKMIFLVRTRDGSLGWWKRRRQAYQLLPGEEDSFERKDYLKGVD